MNQIKNHVSNSILILLILTLISGCSSLNESKNLMSLLKKADNSFNKQEIEKARTLYLETIDAAKKENNKSVLVEAYSQVARCYLKENNSTDGLIWLTRAKDYVTPDEPLGWSRYLGVRGRFEWKQAAAETQELTPVADKAANTFKEMYDYCLQHKLFDRAIDAAHMVAIVSEMDDRIEWGLKGIKAAEEGNVEKWLGPLWNNHGWNLDDLGRYDEALEALKKAREYHYKGKEELPKLIADWSVGHAYRMTGQLDSAQFWMTNVSNRAEKLFNETPDDKHAEWVGFASKELGEISLVKGNKKQALAYFEKAKENLTRVGMPDWDKKGYQEIVDKIDMLSTELSKK